METQLDGAEVGPEQMSLYLCVFILKFKWFAQKKQFEFQEMKARAESRECAANISSFCLIHSAEEASVCVSMGR